MAKSSRIQYFDNEGRENLHLVIKSIKSFLRDRAMQGIHVPEKIVFLTREGEGPLLAYNEGLHSDRLKIIAVTFPLNYAGKRNDHLYVPEIPDRIRKFFRAVEIPIITSRLPLDPMAGADSHNREMALIKTVLSVFGGSIPLGIQAVLQATDAGECKMGEKVICATGDAALLVKASTTGLFLNQDERGLTVDEIICKPRAFNITRKPLPNPEEHKTIDGNTHSESKALSTTPETSEGHFPQKPN